MSKWSDDFEHQFKSVGKLKKFSEEWAKNMKSDKAENILIRKAMEKERRLKKLKGK